MQVKPQVRRTVSVPQPFWASMTEEDEAYSLICAVDRSLADCLKLLREVCVVFGLIQCHFSFNCSPEVV